MLYDAPIKPKAGDRPRKWIADEFFDLIVWYDRRRRIYGFQLCYDKLGQERAVTWVRGHSIQHSYVDSGEFLPTENRAAVLVTGGTFPWRWVKNTFQERSVHLPQLLRRLVLNKLARLGTSPILPFALLSAATGFSLPFAISYFRRL